MDYEHRGKLREAALRRNNCKSCGGTSVREVEGAELSPDIHFPGLTYRVCNGCGHEEVKGVTRGKGTEYD